MSSSATSPQTARTEQIQTILFNTCKGEPFTPKRNLTKLFKKIKNDPMFKAEVYVSGNCIAHLYAN